MTHLVSAAELSELLAGEPRPRLLDVRWRLGHPDGRPDWLAGHIPGAAYVDLERELSAPGRPEEGRHPLPTTEALQRAARGWGLKQGEPVVVYDGGEGLAAARAWWMLRHGGLDVRVLDGGLRAWVAAGGELETGEVVPEPGDVVLGNIDGDSLTIDEAAAFPASGVMLDVRAPERYRGEIEPIDPVAGHIPGAVNLPTTVHLVDDGTMLPLDRVRENFARVGVTPGVAVAAYCGSGLTAAHTALMLAEAGIPARLFHGSWSAWSNSGRPVATGREPGAAG